MQIKVTEHQMMAIMLARYNVPFVGVSIPASFAPGCNERWKNGAANDE